MNSKSCTVADCARILQRRRSKYGNRKTAYNGRVYASAAEARFAAELDLRMRAGEVRNWEAQVRVPLVVAGRLITVYVVDFRVTLADGLEEWVEVKGCTTRDARIKMALFEALYPGRRLKIVRNR